MSGAPGAPGLEDVQQGSSLAQARAGSVPVSSSARWGLSPLGFVAPLLHQSCPAAGAWPPALDPPGPRVRPCKEDPEASTCQESPGDGDSAATCPEDTPPVRPVDMASSPAVFSAFTPQSDPALPGRGSSLLRRRRACGAQTAEVFLSSVSLFPFFIPPAPRTQVSPHSCFCLRLLGSPLSRPPPLSNWGS